MIWCRNVILLALVPYWIEITPNSKNVPTLDIAYADDIVCIFSFSFSETSCNCCISDILSLVHDWELKGWEERTIDSYNWSFICRSYIPKDTSLQIFCMNENLLEDCLTLLESYLLLWSIMSLRYLNSLYRKISTKCGSRKIKFIKYQNLLLLYIIVGFWPILRTGSDSPKWISKKCWCYYFKIC